MTRFFLLNDRVCIRLMLHGKNVQALLKQNDWVEATSLAEADVILVNTCAFLQDVEDATVRRIERLIRDKRPDQRIVVFGCLPDINGPRLAAVHDGDVIHGRDLASAIRLFNLTETVRPIGHTVNRPGDWKVRTVRRLNRWWWHDPYFTYLYDKAQVFHLMISEGCCGDCTYCAERLARGRLVSQPIADIMREFRRGLDAGYRIFSLNADDVGMYGIDRSDSIADLLERMLAMNEDFRLVLTEFNPQALVRHEARLVRILSSPKIVFVTVPIESGSQRILRAMKRHYRVSQVERILQSIRLANPQLKINTHIIVGFPGETEDDHAATRRLLARLQLNKVKVFGFSPRQGTAAYDMEPKVPSKVIAQRRSELTKLVNEQAVHRLDWRALILNHVGFCHEK